MNTKEELQKILDELDFANDILVNQTNKVIPNVMAIRETVSLIRITRTRASSIMKAIIGEPKDQ